LVISATATAGTQTFSSITAAGIETLTVNLQGLTTTASKAVSGITMDISAAPQNLTVTSNALATTLGTVIADSLTTTGVAGSLTATLSSTLVAGATFTGNTTQPSYITTSGNADIITTGSANDAIYVPATATTASWRLDGGLGNDTYSLATTNSAGSVITDAGGVDVLVLTGSAANISGMNNGGTLASMGIDQIFYTGTNVVTVGTNQLGAQAINGISSGATPVITLAAAGTMNVSSLVVTQIAAGSYLSAAGVATTSAGVAVTGFTLNGSSGADSVVGSALPDTIAGLAGADTITGGAGADTISGGSGKDIIYTSASSSTLTSSDLDVISLIFGDTQAYTSNATTVSVTQADVIYGMGLSDVITLASTTATMAYTATGSAATGVFTAVSVVTANTAAGSNTAFIGRGTYDATNGSFTWSSSGLDSLVVYDQDSSLATIDAVAIVLVGYATTTVASIAIGSGGGLNMTLGAPA